MSRQTKIRLTLESNSITGYNTIMPFETSLILVLEKHPLSGMLLKVQDENKKVSGISADIPHEIRTLCKRSMMQQDISKDLLTLLNDHPTRYQVAVKVGGKVTLCEWDPEFVHTVQLQCSINQGFVSIVESGMGRESVILAKHFCRSYN